MSSDAKNAGGESADVVAPLKDSVADLPAPDTFRHTKRGSIQFRRQADLLGNKLMRRPTRQQFRERFLAKEQARENVFSQTKMLNSFLARRPTMKALQQSNILPHGSSSFSSTRLKLERQRKKDKLKTLIALRSSADSLRERGILRPVMESKEEKEQKGRAKRMKEASSSLAGLLERRLNLQDLQKRNIYQDPTATAEKAKVKKERTEFLSNFLTRRVSKAVMESKGIIRPTFHDTQAKLGGLLARRRKPDHLIHGNILKLKDTKHMTKNECKSTSANQFTLSPVSALAGKKIVGIGCGWAHSAFLDDSGILYMCGMGDNGRLGRGDDHTESSATPVANDVLQQLGPVSAVSCGDNHTAAIVGGDVYTWGVGTWGRLGLGSQDDVATPTKVDLGDEKAVSVSCGSYHTFVVTATNSVYAFGWHKSGALGLGKQDLTSRTLVFDTPHKVDFLSAKDLQVAAIVSGQGSTAALTSQGHLYTWGAGFFGGLGHGDKKERDIPSLVKSLQDVKLTHVAVGASFMLAVADTGALYSFGSNRDSQLCRPSKSGLLPVQVDNFEAKGISSISAHTSHALLVRDSALYGIGCGKDGVLGTGDASNVDFPLACETLKDDAVAEVATGAGHTLVRYKSGKVYACGSGKNGKLGTGAK